MPKALVMDGVVRGQCEIFKAMDCEEFAVCFAVLRDAAWDRAEKHVQ